jgi:hypothetical protein
MNTKSLLVILVLSLSSLALAQPKQSPPPAGDSATTCTYTFSSGSGKNATQFCVTATGNITQFSRPAGVEYLATGTIGEGYAVCEFPSFTSYTDWAGFGGSGWGPPTLISSTAAAVKISRISTDGVFQWTQTITKVNATAKGPGAATVSMALKNLTGVEHLVHIIRYADVNANSATTNDFDATLDTSYGLQPSYSYGLGGTNNTFTFNWNAIAQNVPGPPDPCGPYINQITPPFVGDGSIMQIWLLTLPKNATKTFAMTYKPI